MTREEIMLNIEDMLSQLEEPMFVEQSVFFKQFLETLKESLKIIKG